MATSISSTSKSGIENLDSYYQNLVNYTLLQEKQPITRLTEQKDAITVKKAAYTDLKTKFDTLQTAINKLRSSHVDYTLSAGRSVSVAPGTTGTTVASATVGSSVSAGTYALSVTSLAKAHEVHSIKQTVTTGSALGLTGSFVIGGEAERSAAINAASPERNNVASITSGGTNIITTGHKELGTGSYFIETREESAGVWQFRMVDADGVVQNIKDGNSLTSFTSSWQNIPTDRAYDTGRGLSIQFGVGDEITPFTAGSLKLDYVAQGATVEVTSSMSLVDINYAINEATYGAGNEIVSSIIDNTLVLKNQSTGLNHVMQAKDNTGFSVLQDLGILKSSTPDDVNTKVAASDASFSINNMEMTRSSNTGLTDVISGMTLDLASDAEGKSANLVVKTDMSAAQNLIKSFMTTFNDLTKYIRGNTGTTKNADDTYTRGSLAGEFGIRNMGNELISLINQDQSNTGLYQNFTQLGISVNSDLALAVTDSSKFTTALNNNFSDVTKLLDAAMGSLANRIDTYAGTSGYVNQTIQNSETTVTNLTSRITSLNERINRREVALVKYYADYQAQMETYMNQSSLNSALYG
jgi:flagellar capping protein FliD